MANYLTTKELGTQGRVINFRLVTGIASEKFKTKYDYYKKYKKAYSLIIKDKDTGKYKYWDTNKGGWEQLVLEEWSYINQFGKNVSYLEQQYTYDIEFEKEESFSIWDGKKTFSCKEAKLDLSWSQNELIKKRMEKYQLTKWYSVEKEGKSWTFIPEGDVPESLINNGVVEQSMKAKQIESTQATIDMGGIVDVEQTPKVQLEPIEQDLITNAKKQNKTVDEFKSMLEMTGLVVKERIDIVVGQY
jgi:hypothetical protein